MNSQNGPEYGDGVVPKTAAPCPAFHRFSGDGSRSGDVVLLPLAHISRQGPIVEQDIVLIIEIKAPAIHVGGTDQRNLPVQSQGLGVKQSTLVFKDSYTGVDQVAVIASTCRTDEP